MRVKFVDTIQQQKTKQKQNKSKQNQKETIQYVVFLPAKILS